MRESTSTYKFEQMADSALYLVVALLCGRPRIDPICVFPSVCLFRTGKQTREEN